jgi:hypothetical protein
VSDGGAETVEDVIEFHGGRFHSADCDDQAFTTGAYSTTVNSGVISFQAVITSLSHGRMNWCGSVSGDTIEGIVTCGLGEQSTVSYIFHGEERCAFRR